MKKFFKFVPVALGLMALASCSNDEFESQSVAAGQQLAAGDLIVTEDALETEGGGTRSYLSRDMQTRYYVVTDEMKVYDNGLHKYDEYAFRTTDETSGGGMFTRKNATSQITEAKWALYPRADVVPFSEVWEYNEVTDNTETRISMNIPTEMVYDGTYDPKDTKFEKPLYKDVLPRWGQVSSIASGALQTNLSYMTGVLRLQLAGIPTYAEAVRIQMFEGGLATNPVRMTGDFETIIAKNDVKMPDASLAGESMPSGFFDAIYVDLTQAEWFKAPLINPEDAAKAVVYVPLVTTTKNVDIVVSLCKSLANPDDITDDFDNGGGTNIYEEYKRFKDKKITRGKVYGNSKQYNLALTADEGPNEISDALALEEVAEGEDLTIKVKGDINVCDPDNTILIPNKKAASITIDLSDAEVLASCNPTLYVKYKDASGEGKFPGQVTIIAGNTASNPVDMEVSLDATPFRFVGDEAGDIATMKIDAKEFTLGNHSSIPSNYKNANIALSDNVQKVTIGGNATTDEVIATWGDGQNVSNIVVNGQVTGNVDGSAVGYITTNVEVSCYGWADGEATVGGNINTNGKIDILGKATVPTGNITANGDVTINNNYGGAQAYAGTITSNQGNVSINSTGAYATFNNDITTGAWQGGADFTITGKAKVDNGGAATVTTKNAKIDVDANNGNCEAITGFLKYSNNGNLELLQGYIGEVNPNNKTVTLSFAEKGAFAAMNVTAGQENRVRPGDNVSVWNGRDIPASLRATYVATDCIWTATQLGTQSYNWGNAPTTYDPEIRSNIDLDNKDWKGIYADAAYTMNGKANPNEASKTIKNINLVQTKVGSKWQAGFIYQADATVDVDDLSLAGVKTSIKALGGDELKGVGGFVGVAAGAVTMNRVNVKLAAGYFGSMDGTKNVNASNIGGIIGRAEGALNLKGCTADLTGAILAGHRSLGGFVGGAKDDISILTDPEYGDRPETACAVIGLTQMWVTLLDLQEYENDPEQASTGLYIGQAALAKTINIEGAADVNPSFTVGGKVDESKAFIVNLNKIHQFSRGDQKLIGQSGYYIGADLKINGQKYGVKKTGEPFTDGNKVLYNVTVTSFH